MNQTPSAGPFAFIRQFADRLRYPQLFVITAGLFVVDLFVPDIIPFADEILLGLLTVLFARLKDRSKERAARHDEDVGGVKNVTPKG